MHTRRTRKAPLTPHTLMHHLLHALHTCIKLEPLSTSPIRHHLINHLNPTPPRTSPKALWEITRQRLLASPPDTVITRVFELATRHGVRGVSLALAEPHSQRLQTICSGKSRISGEDVTPGTLFEVASLSKTVFGCFQCMHGSIHINELYL